MWLSCRTLANVYRQTPDLTATIHAQFGFERALHDFSNGCRGVYFQKPFVEGDGGI